ERVQNVFLCDTIVIWVFPGDLCGYLKKVWITSGKDPCSVENFRLLYKKLRYLETVGRNSFRVSPGNQLQVFLCLIV
ncbi:hypothetical protein NSB04_28455, partial [Blautia pseudococcoides]|nr:hypothetical protein [Blautia pseudococcoides]